MKLSTFLALATIGQSNGLSCPELSMSESISSSLTMYYAIVTSAVEPSILCARLESMSEAWVGFGINPSGEMVGAEAVIALPDEGSVKKYLLNGKDVSAVVKMEEAAQTLMDTSVTQENGVTIVTFTKYMDEDQYPISEGANTFIYAIGSSNDLNYHAERGSFTLELEAEETTTSSSDVTSTDGTVIETLPTPTSTAAAFDTLFDEGNITSIPTYSPTIIETETTNESNVTYSPTTVGTSTIEQAATPAPSVISNPLLRTSMPTSISGGVGSIVDWNETDTDDMAESNESSTASTEMSSPSSTNAVGNETEVELSTPSPTIVDDISTQPTTASSFTSTYNSTDASTNSTNVAQDGSQENSESDFSFGGSSANEEDFNGASALFNGIGSALIGVIAFVALF